MKPQMEIIAISGGHPGYGWADISEDIVEEIMKKIGPTADFPRFASACKAWYSVASRIKNPQWRKLPWLLLATRDHGGPDGDYSRSFWKTTTRSFYSPSDITFHEIQVSPVRRCIGSADGWLVMLGCTGTPYFEKAIHVLNPITRRQVMLPPASTITGVFSNSTSFACYSGFVNKVYLSCSPLSRECVALAIHCPKSSLSIARPGDKAWTAVTMEKRADQQWPFDNGLFYQGQFYAVNSGGEMWRIDPATGGATLLSTSPCREKKRRRDRGYVDSWSNAHYLVESSGDLFYVFRSRLDAGVEDTDGDLVYWTSAFHVFKVSMRHGVAIWEKVTSLGDRSFFLGFAVSKSVNAAEVADCRGNCIYFTDDRLYYSGGRGAGPDMGFYSLEDDKAYRYQPYIDSIFDDDINISSPSTLVLPDSRSPLTPPVWFFPSLE